MSDEKENYADRNKRMANDPKNKLGAEDKGLQWDRSCTDVICCLLFAAFIVCILGVSFYAYGEGDPSRILTPFDSDGNACGEPDQCSNDKYAWPQGTACVAGEFKIPADAQRNAGVTTRIPPARDFTDYKYKYFTLTSANFFTAVCVKECPTVTYSAQQSAGKCVRSDDADGVEYQDYTTNSQANLEACKNSCFMNKKCYAYEQDVGNCNIWVKEYTDVNDNTVTIDTPPKGNGDAGKTCYIKDEGTMTKVAYMSNDDEVGMPLTGDLYALFPTEERLSICMPTKEVGVELLNKMLESLDESTGMVKYLVELGEVWGVLLGMTLGTVVISLVYIWLLKCITKPLLYTSMALILLLFILCGAWCYMKMDDYDKELEENNYNAAMTGCIVCWVIAGLYLVFICCCWKNIALGASIMEAASAFVTSTKRVLWLPILAYAVCVPYLIYWVVSAVFLYSIGEPYFKPNSFFAEIKWTDNTNYMWWFFLFGLCWSIAFIICVQQFMIAATVCQWYFGGQGQANSDSAHSTSVVRSFIWAMWYHCGSIAFGSFLIALITIIRIIFEYLIYKFEQYGDKDNCVYKVAKCYIRYVLWCLDKYIKFITKNAFIQIALRNNNFCKAAWMSFYLIIRNAGRFSATSMVGWIMMFLGKGTIMGVSCYLTFVIVQESNPDFQQPLLPALIILMVSYLVASIFLSVFSFAATTILHCFIFDEDTGGQSGITPESLRPFLDKYDKGAAKDANNQSATGNMGGKGNDMN